VTQAAENNSQEHDYGTPRRMFGQIVGVGAILVPLILVTTSTSDKCDLDDGAVARLLLQPALSAAVLWFIFVLVTPPPPLRASAWRYVFAATAAVTGAVLFTGLGLAFLNTADCRG
jgi:hypothetical protein